MYTILCNYGLYLNGINVHELISLRFNMHIGAGKGGSMGGHAGMPVWDTGYGGTYAIVGQLAYGT